jgi:GNAT superfamily N-acetyltransferase
MIEYAKETYDQVIEDIKPLLDEHWEELAAFPDIPLDPNFDFYQVASNRGAIRIYTARKDGELIGYAIYIINLSNPHYMETKWAISDIVLVRKPYRNAKVGTGLYDFIEADLPGFIIVTNDKIAHPELGALMRARGYDAYTTAWMKRL